jgi:hypothetical protein
VHDQQLAVLLREHDGGVGGEVVEAVLRDQAELVVADQRVVLDENVRAAARVVGEAGEGERLGAGVAAGGVVGLDDDDVEPGAGEVGGSDQRVVAGADDHDVGLGREGHPGRVAGATTVCKSGPIWRVPTQQTDIDP